MERITAEALARGAIMLLMNGLLPNKAALVCVFAVRHSVSGSGDIGLETGSLQARSSTLRMASHKFAVSLWLTTIIYLPGGNTPAFHPPDTEHSLVFIKTLVLSTPS